MGSGNKVIALRADIDALPIEEAASVPFRSLNAGVMHACGHDIHTSVILGAALLLKQREAQLAGRVRILFQPAVYVMTNVSINLLLVKFRQQFGLRAFTEGFLVLYVLVTFFHLFVNDLSSALMVRAAHGMVAAALSSLGIYYQVQAWPARHRLKALTIGITGSSLAIPLARLFSTELLQIDEWRGLYFFELGLALVSLACWRTLLVVARA